MPGAPPPPKLSDEDPFVGASHLPPKPSISRKRGFEDGEDAQSHNGHQQYGERAYKQPRRGGRRNDGFNGHMPQGLLPNIPQGVMPNMPPFDPANPMEAFMRMQAMGIQFPGMPDYRGHGPGNRQRKRRRCRDFENKGYCSRGSTCQFDHGQEPDVALGKRCTTCQRSAAN